MVVSLVVFVVHKKLSIYLSIYICTKQNHSMLNISRWNSKPKSEAKGAIWSVPIVYTVIYYTPHLCSISTYTMQYLQP